MSVTPSAHAASHADGGNDALTRTPLVLGAAGYLLFTEMTAPSAPAATKAALFVRINGSSKSELCFRAETGAIVVVATEP